LNDLKHAALTEDDYFDFLSDFTTTVRQEQVVYIMRRLVSSSLLFLGFRIDQPEFQRLFRSILGGEGKGFSRRYRHVAQVDPIDNRMTDPKGAKEYLSLLFDEDDVKVYWGGSDDFLAKLIQELG
jgi:hypothetical protein